MTRRGAARDLDSSVEADLAGQVGHAEGVGHQADEAALAVLQVEDGPRIGDARAPEQAVGARSGNETNHGERNPTDELQEVPHGVRR